MASKTSRVSTALTPTFFSFPAVSSPVGAGNPIRYDYFGDVSKVCSTHRAPHFVLVWQAAAPLVRKAITIPLGETAALTDPTSPSVNRDQSSVPEHCLRSPTRLIPFV